MHSPESHRFATYRQTLTTNVRRGLRGIRHSAQLWLRSHPKVRKLLRVTGCMETHPAGIARGIAVGLMASLTPIFGFQMIALVLGCTLLRANFLAAFLISWISNPFTVAPLYWSYHQIGRALFSSMPLFGTSQPYMQGLGDEVIFVALGSAVVSIPCTILGYLLTYRIAHGIALRRQRQRDAAAPTQSDERVP